MAMAPLVIDKLRTVLAACLVSAAGLVLTACGGGGGVTVSTTGTGSTSTSTTTTTGTLNPSTTPTTGSGTATTVLLLTGIAYPLATNNSVHVPAGTIIAGANGSVITLNGGVGPVNVVAGSIITVPLTATGPANILVTTNPALAVSIATTLPTSTAVAGSATYAGPPSDGVGASATFWGGGHLAADNAGNVLVSDGGALRSVSPAQAVTTLAAGYIPYDWEGIAVDSARNVYGSGTSYAPPPNNYGASIQKRTAAGGLGTVVSNWTASATVTALGYGGLAVDTSGNLYLTDAGNHRILKFTPGGVMSVFAGNGTAGVADGAGAAARFNNPTDLGIDGGGNLFVADTNNNAIRKITPAGVVTTVATQQQAPGPIAVSPTGVIYFMGGSPRALVRVPADLSISVSYPTTGISPDPITGLAVDPNGVVYAGTHGVGAQILRIGF